jgi:hypothetical protein
VSVRALAAGVLTGSLAAALVLSLWWPGAYVAVALAGAAVAVCWLVTLALISWAERRRGTPPPPL